MSHTHTQFTILNNILTQRSAFQVSFFRIIEQISTIKYARAQLVLLHQWNDLYSLVYLSQGGTAH